MSVNESTSTVDIYIASAQTQGEKVLAAEVERLRAENAKLKTMNAVYRVCQEMECENPPDECNCTGSIRALEYYDHVYGPAEEPNA